MQLPTLVPCPAFTAVSPSLAADLSLCFYRAAQERAPEVQTLLQLHPAAALGTIAHGVLDRAKRREFTWPEDLEVLSQSAARCIANDLWNMEVQNATMQVRTRLRFADPRKWPNYALKRARTIQHAAGLLTGLVSENGTSRKQVGERGPSDGPAGTHADLIGVPDNLVFTERGIVVEEFKTGKIYDADGQVEQRFVDQVNIYSYLVHETYGSWPILVRIYSIDGGSYQAIPDPREATELTQRLRGLLHLYQVTHSEAGEDPHEQMNRLASPSPASCFGCRVRPWCKPYWLSGEGTSGSRYDLRGLLVQPWTGAGPLVLDTDYGTVVIAGLMTWYPDLTLETGVTVHLLNLRPLPNSEGYLFDGHSELWWQEGGQQLW